MARQDGAKNYEFSIDTQFGGYNSTYDKTLVNRSILVYGSQNVYKTLAGTIAVRPGQKRIGDADSTLAKCDSEYVWNTSWGATYTLVVANDILWLVFEDTWYQLQDSLTQTRYVFDKWWDNTEKKDRVLFVNGSSDLFHWSGGFATVQSSTAATITKSGSTTWQQAGFATNTAGEKKVTIEGTEYTYTGGENTTTLTGVTPSAAGITPGATAIQSVITESDTPAASYANDFIKVINNQAYIGSYTSRITYISSNTDFTDYVVPTPRASGDPELITLDDVGKGIAVRQGNAHIGFGKSGWAVIRFNDITVGSTLTQQTTVDIKPVATLAAPYAHEFIDTVGDSIVYLSQDQQVRIFGDFTNLFTSGYPTISQEINTELSIQDFSGGGLRAIGEYVYITAPNSGKVYLYQVRQSVDANNQIIQERLWHTPFVWNVTRIDDRNGVVIGFSNANPQIYQLWDTDQYYDDSPSDEELPYECIAAFGYDTQNRRQGLMSFDKVFSEGYISEGTPLNLTINYNYKGALSTITVPINSSSRPAYTFQSESGLSLGDSSIGEEPIGDEIVEVEPDNNLPKFKVINSIGDQNCFEYQLVYSSLESNARWELLAKGTNVQVADDQLATFIINKVRS